MRSLSWLLGLCVGLAGCAPSTERVPYLVVYPEVRIQDLTGSGIASLSDWVKAPPEVVEKTAVVEFRLDLIRLTRDIRDAVQRSQTDPGDRRDPLQAIQEDDYEKQVWAQIRAIKEHGKEPAAQGLVVPAPPSIRIRHCLENPSAPYQEAKRIGLEALRELEVEIDGRPVDLARTAILDWYWLYSHVLLEVGPHEVRVTRGQETVIQGLDISANQKRLSPKGARGIRAKDISGGVDIDLYRDRSREEELSVSVRDDSRKSKISWHSDAHFGLISIPRLCGRCARPVRWYQRLFDWGT